MGGIWLLDLPDWLNAGGLDVDTYPGWETKSRASGGYDAVLAIGTHHTAGSGRYPKADMKWMWGTSPFRPVGAIYLSTKGAITVGAAGATNTQGRGGPYQTSRGLIPKNAGNRYILSIEAANSGTGVEWPEDQLAAYIEMVGILTSRLNLDPRQDVLSHHTWAPGRKIDPSGPTPSYPTLGGTSGNESWPDSSFAELVVAKQAPPDPTPNVSVVPRPMLQRGSRGPDVAKLINILKWCKWYPAAYQADINDGVYGLRTEAGVSTMQRSLRVEATGTYDEPTSAALERLILGDTDEVEQLESKCLLPNPSKPGATGPAVAELQRMLQSRGWYRYSIDSDYGRLTKQGVQQFQRACQLAGNDPGPVDGWFGARTRQAGCDTFYP